jgi:hypothetical protein
VTDKLEPFEPSGFSSDPVVVMKAIDRDAQWMDWLGKALDTATDQLDEAEKIWDEHYDKVGDDLKQEMIEEGRKGDPPAHWIESRARKENRVAYQNLRRAKRLVEKLEKQIRAASAAMNGRQSELAGLRDENRAPPTPDWARQRTAP